MQSPPSIQRRLIQFNLRTLLLIIFVVAISLAFWREQKPATGYPTDWKPGKFSRNVNFPGGVPPQSRNIKWAASLGSQTYSSPVVSGGRVFIGTNNNNPSNYLPRYSIDKDFGVLLCFAAEDGKFLWQATSAKVMQTNVQPPFMRMAEDHPRAGVSSTPVVAGERLWYVNNRAEVVCLDTAGFHDGENDGAVQDEPKDEHEADVIWKFDMRKSLGVYVHEFSPCRPATDGKRVFVVTGNGVDQSHLNLPNPTAPSFIALDRQTGKLLWTDNSPGGNVLHMQWGSPTYAVIGRVPQVIFPGGDGWLYSFDPAGTPQGKSKLLWKFDLNPKASVYQMGGRGDRNETAFHVTVEGDRVFAVAGQDAEHGEGPSTLWCIDATRRGDISAELAVHQNTPTVPLPPRRGFAIDVDKGEIAVPNPNSGVIWKFAGTDLNQNGKIEFDESVGRTRGAVVVQDDVALVSDFSGYTHCFNAKTGQRYWVHDNLAACWNSPLIAGRHAYIVDEDGDVTIFDLFRQPGQKPNGLPVAEINMLNSIYSQPTAADGVLYIATKDKLFAIENPPPKN